MKLAGAAAGVLAIPSPLFAFGHDAKKLTLHGPPVSIGLLLPQSSLYPHISKNFLAGMHLYFDNIGSAAGGRPIRIVTVDSGIYLPVGVSRQLATIDRVDLIGGLIHSGAAATIKKFLPEIEVPFIASSIGECMPREGEKHPSVFNCTLNAWQAEWAMGSWSARHLGKKGFIASSFHDSGYDGISAFRLGFEAAGGKIVETAVSHRETDRETPARIIDRVARCNPDFVYAAYCGGEAVEFISSVKASLPGIPLVGSSFLTDEGNIKKLGEAASGIRTFSSWSSALPSPENMEFMAAYRQKMGRVPDAFALLGYDTAGIIASALNDAGGNMALFPRALRGVEMRSPRGIIRMDPVTNSIAGPLYLREARIGNGVPSNTVLSETTALSELDDRVTGLRSAMRSGWNNAFMCV